MRKIILSLFLGICIANAQILQVEQLFNRKLVKVKKEPQAILKSFYGTTILDERKTIDIVSRFDGYITRLDANETYKNIKKGNTLFTIYSDEVLLIQQELQLAKKINQALVNSSIEKLKALDINQAIINKIKSSNKVYKNIPFYSPLNSIVIEKNINDGSYVKKGALLLRLSSLDEIWFIAKVYQKDLAFLKNSLDNLEAKVKLEGIEKSFKTKIDYIYPNVDQKTKSVDVRFVLQNKDLEIFSNMFGEVKIKTNKKDRLTLPKTAVLNKGNKFYVFKAISKKEFEPILVEAKRIASNKYEILEGLQEGEEVIANALFLLDSDAITNNLYEADDDDW